MRFAYADPPYLGSARKTYGRVHPDRIETHTALIERLCDEFPDGWALSLHEPSLRAILALCPPDARVGAWMSQMPKLTPTLTVGRNWEPVIWRGGRGGPRRCGDAVLTLAGGAARPRAFAQWVFDLLGARRGDAFVDLFPGSGAIGAAWAERIGAQPDLPLTPLEALARGERGEREPS